MVPNFEMLLLVPLQSLLRVYVMAPVSVAIATIRYDALQCCTIVIFN